MWLKQRGEGWRREDMQMSGTRHGGPHGALALALGKQESFERLQAQEGGDVTWVIKGSL